jgi:hypothetical protein
MADRRQRPGAPIAARLAQRQPIGGPIDRAPESGGIDEGLQQQKRMAEPLWPVSNQAALTKLETRLSHSC